MSGRLAAFYAARLDEDEDLLSCGSVVTNDEVAAHQRAEREVTAGRAILAAYEGWSASDSPDYWPGLNLAVKALAAVHRDHPGYDPAWALAG